jgi:hypothetical protein
LLAVLAGFVPIAGRADDPPQALDTRAGIHDGYARLVFAAPDKNSAVVPMTATLDGTQLTIKFDQPVAPRLDAVRGLLGTYLDSVSLSPDGRTVTARMKRPVQLRAQQAGKDIDVLDLIDDQPQKPEAPPAADKPPAPPVAVRPPAAVPAASNAAVAPAAKASSQAPQSAPALAQAAPPAPNPVPLVAPQAPPVAPPPAPQTAAAIAQPLPAPPVEQQPLPAPAPPKPAPAAPAAAAKPLTGTVGKAAEKGVQIRYTVLDDGVSIRFEWTNPTAAAVFRRGGAVWIVFDRAQRVDFSDFKPGAWPVVSAIAEVPTRSGTAFRLDTQGGYDPAVRRAGNDWIVDLQPKPPHLDGPLQPVIRHDGGADTIGFMVLDPTSPISIADPEAGDSIVVVPLPQLGQGMMEGLVYPDVEVLGAIQGLAFRPVTDQLAIRSLPDQVELSSPGGLMLSSDSDRNLPPRPPRVSGTLLSPSAWQGKLAVPFTTREQALLGAISAGSDDDRTDHRVDLAKFYFANGLAAETLGVLRNAQRDVPNLTDDPSIRLMQGAAELMMRQDEIAAADLGDRSLDGRVDTALWRAALAAEQQDWKTADQLGKQGKDALPGYPPWMRNRLALALADAMLRADDPAAALPLAQAVIDGKPTRGQADEAHFLAGRIAADQHETQKAMAHLNAAASSPAIDLGRAQATFALTVMRYESGALARPDAIAAIDRLRYAWRGDDFELQVLNKLAELYVADGNYRGAFDTLARIPAGYPDTQAARDATDQMSRDFVAMFIGPDADKVAPLTALGMYQQFKELTPSGEQGDAIIRKLADRMVAVDLLEPAGNLLADQVKSRLTGVEQARVSAQLALVRLMDNRPADAIAALDAVPAATELPADLVRQRAELRARAQFGLGKPDDALATLTGDDGADADKLRAEIYAKTQNWPKLAALLQSGLKDPDADGKLDPETASTVLRLATALTFAQDKAGLAALQKRYAAAMDQSSYKDAFRIVAGSGTDADGAKTVADKVAQIGDLQSFMEGYRQRVQQDKLSAIN